MLSPIYKVLIVENEIENINLLKIYINKYCKTIHEVYAVTNPKEAIDSYLEHQQNILLLDIELDDNIKSFSIVESILKMSKSVPEIIFITSHTDYAIQVINDLEITAYLIKPLKPEDLVIAIAKAVKKIDAKHAIKDVEIGLVKSESNIIAIPSLDKIDLINFNSIVYLEADGKYTVFHLKDGTKKVASFNLGKYEKELNPTIFFRIHNSFIVNSNMISKISKSDGNCEFHNNVVLPIAKRRRDDLRSFLKLK